MNQTQHFKFPLQNQFMPTIGSEEELARKRVTRQMQDLTKDWHLKQHDALELYRTRAADACLEHITTLAMLGEKAAIRRIFHYVSVCKSKVGK